jgi:hypothetical protein
MGMFDTIRAVLSCSVCGSASEREIQTKQGPCVLLNLEVGDTIEPFFHGDYWMREQWYCKECQRNTPENKRWDNPNDVFIHCLNGLIVEITTSRPPEGRLPDWNLIHRLSRDRLRYREALSRIKNTVEGFRRRQEAEGKPRPALLNFGPKTVDELLDKIVEQAESAEKGEPPSMF